MRVLVVQRNEAMRRGIEAMLHAIGIVRDVTTCTDAAEADALASAHRPDVLITDFDDHRADAVESLAEKARRGRAKVLLLMRGPGEVELSAAARLRGDGYLVEEDLTVPLLEDTLLRLMVDEVPMPSAMARELLHRVGGSPAAVSPPPADGFSRLTMRERQALSLLVEGMSNKQMARRMCISDHAIKRVMASMLVKLNCANRTQAVALALKSGLAGTGRM